MRTGTCRNCGYVIRTGYLSCQWFHKGTGKVHCEIDGIVPVAEPEEVQYDEWGLEKEVEEV